MSTGTCDGGITHASTEWGWVGFVHVTQPPRHQEVKPTHDAQPLRQVRGWGLPQARLSRGRVSRGSQNAHNWLGKGHGEHERPRSSVPPARWLAVGNGTCYGSAGPLLDSRRVASPGYDRARGRTPRLSRIARGEGSASWQRPEARAAAVPRVRGSFHPANLFHGVLCRFSQRGSRIAVLHYRMPPGRGSRRARSVACRYPAMSR
jgi:hypothetical protein